MSVYVYKCFEKVVVMLDESESDHTAKLEACKFLAVMGQRLLDNKHSFIGLAPSFVAKKLQALTSDRVLKVQMAARESLRVWKKLEAALNEIEQMKMRVKFDVRDPEQLIALKMKQTENFERSAEDSFDSPRRVADSAKLPEIGRTAPLKRSRSPAVGNRQEAEDSLEMKTFSSKQNSIARGADVFKSNNLVEKTYLKQRAHNYQKKRTGTGGGFISEFDAKEQKRKKSSFNEMREKFRQQVMHDKLSYTRKDNRSKYQSAYAEDQENSYDHMEHIEEDPNDLKESKMITMSNLAAQPLYQREPIPPQKHQETLQPVVFEKAEPERGLNEEPTLKQETKVHLFQDSLENLKMKFQRRTHLETWNINLIIFPHFMIR